MLLQHFKHTDIILSFLLLIGAVFPSMGTNCDPVSTRWYIVAIILFLLCLKQSCGCENINSTQYVISFSKAASIVLIFEYLYVIFCFAIRIIGNRHTNGALTGSLDNPHDFSFTICALLPISLISIKHLGMRCAMIMASIAFIYLSASRTGLLAIVIILTLIMHIAFRFRMVGFKVICIMTIVAYMAYSLVQKPDSNSGRFFILQQTWNLIRKHPFLGNGEYGFKKQYMLEQANYFRSAMLCDTRVDLPKVFSRNDSEAAWLADDVRHPLNEFALIWVNYGMAGLLLLLVLLFFPLFYSFLTGHFTKVGIALIPVVLFSLSSYPLLNPLPWIIIFFFYSSILSIHTLKKELLLFAVVVGLYSSIIFLEDSGIKQNPEYLYNKARSAYRQGQFKQALYYLERCQLVWDGYNVQLLKGDILRHLYTAKRKDSSVFLERAEDCYRLSAYMCPNRLAPLEGLLYIYKTRHDKYRFTIVGNIIKSKQAKVNSKETFRIKQLVK